MKKLFYFIIILIFGACSVTTEETEDNTNYGTNEGSASSPTELTVGTAKNGSVGQVGYSYYKFTTSSGAGSYKLAIASLVITDSYYSSSYVYTSIYSNSGYTSTWDYESCLADCILYFDYKNLDNNTSYYLQMSGYGAVTYSLTVSKGGSEGSAADPVELILSAAHPGTIDNVEGANIWDYGYSYYKFKTSAADNYTLTMNNSDDLDCYLYSNSTFTSAVSNSYNGCTSGENLSGTFTGSSSSAGLSANTVYYLRIDGESSTAKTTTYNITVAPEG